jgi:tetratricopeptide (TPR) repeat protein
MPGLLAVACLLTFALAKPAQAQLWSIFSYGLGNFTGSSQGGPGANQAIGLFNQGVHDLNGKRAADAEQHFRMALQLYPGIKGGQGALGQALIEQGKYLDAMPFIEQSVRDDPHHAGNWLNLAQCAQHLHRYGEALDAYRHFLSMERHTSATEFAETAVSILEHTYMSTPQTVATDAASTYLDDARSNYCWDTSKMPIRVCIQPGLSVFGYRPEFAQIARDAFNAWTACTSGRITFQFVDDPSAAQILFHWTSNRAEIEAISNTHGKELGVAKTHRDARGLVEWADILVLTILDEQGIATVNDIRSRAKLVDCHEIGHALGLHHSSKAWDTMSSICPPLGLEFPLTMRDRNTMMAQYDEMERNIRSGVPSIAMQDNQSPPTGVAALPDNFNGAMAKDFLKALNSGKPVPHFDSPPPAAPPAQSDISEDLCNRLNQEASDANKAHQFSVAIQKLEQAHNIAPDNATIARNLALSYSNAAAERSTQNDLSGAKKLYERSLQLLAQGSDQQLYQAILGDYQNLAASLPQ